MEGRSQCRAYTSPGDVATAAADLPGQFHLWPGIGHGS